MELRERILSEIKRLAKADGGRPPGRRKFELETGIKNAHWSGVLWARWGDALAEAGFAPNAFNPRHDSDALLGRLVEAVRHCGKLPTQADLELYQRDYPEFPSDKTGTAHFRGRALLVAALRRRADEDSSCADILPLLPGADREDKQSAARARKLPGDGWVYLIKSGSHYKIGRGENLERRVKEIRVALPEAGTLVRAIRTDDPAGIESYWHRRFEAPRANGEWFRLTPADVSAFKRRKFH